MEMLALYKKQIDIFDRQKEKKCRQENSQIHSQQYLALQLICSFTDKKRRKWHESCLGIMIKLPKKKKRSQSAQNVWQQSQDRGQISWRSDSQIIFQSIYILSFTKVNHMCEEKMER